MVREEEARLLWMKLYEKNHNAGVVCRRCGISRPTLRKRWRRYQQHGLEGLKSQSKKPRTSPNTKIGNQKTTLILELRRKRKMGARRIQAELKRLHECSLSLATIHKVLIRAKCKPLQKPRRKKGYKRYSRPIPGDRVQMDTCKIAPGFYQYTAIDDCSRFMVLALFGRRTAGHTLSFLEKVCEEMPFPIQRIQTDRGMTCPR